MRHQSRTPEELRKISEHLHYEIETMQHAGMNALLTPETNLSFRCFLESYALHLRNLIEFFFHGRGKNHENASEFIESTHLPMWKLIVEEERKPLKPDFLYGKASKQVVHLTLAREEFVGEEKQWDAVFPQEDLIRLYRYFLLMANPKFLCTKSSAMRDALIQSTYLGDLKFEFKKHGKTFPKSF